MHKEILETYDLVTLVKDTKRLVNKMWHERIQSGHTMNYTFPQEQKQGMGKSKGREHLSQTQSEV